MASGKPRVCPVCDASVGAGVRTCPECGTDLSLFDVDRNGIPDLDAAPAPKGKSIDDILASIGSEKEAPLDIFEDIKSIGSEQAAATPVEAVEFQCPSCGATVAAEAKRCPSCGAEFAEETVEQFECPLCNAVVDVSATSCPSCGVQFAEEAEEAAPIAPARPTTPTPAPTTPPKREPAPFVVASAAPAATVQELEAEAAPPEPAPKPVSAAAFARLSKIVEARQVAAEEEPADRSTLFRELPRLVAEVKPLLLIAKKLGVEIGEEKELISDAIAHGKKRDVERAVHLIREARFRLDGTFTTSLAKRVETLLVDVDRAQQTGAQLGEVMPLCMSAIEALERRDYTASADKVKAAKQEFDARSGGYGKARQEYEATKTLLADAKRLGFDVTDATAYFKKGESALRARNWDEAAGLAVQARQTIMSALPDALSREMKNARNALLEMKVKGGDLAKPVGILKQASIHIKREEYGDAVRFVAMFWDQVGRS